MRLIRIRDASAVLAVALLSGCSDGRPPIVEVEGIVLLNGVPLPHAKVRFFPQVDDASDYIAQAVTDDAGRFRLTCRGLSGACVAPHVVTVSEDDLSDRLTTEAARTELHAHLRALKNRPIPPKYRIACESGIEVTVVAGRGEYRIELKR